MPLFKHRNPDDEPDNPEPDALVVLRGKLEDIRRKLHDLALEEQATLEAYRADGCDRKGYETETDWLTMKRQSLLRRQQEILAKIDTTTSHLARLALRDQPDNE